MQKTDKKVSYHLYSYEIPSGRQLHKITLMRAPKERMYAVVNIKEKESIVVVPKPIGRDEFLFDFSPLELFPEEIVEITFYSRFPERK